MKVAVLVDRNEQAAERVVLAMLRAMATDAESSVVWTASFPGGAFGGVGRPGESIADLHIATNSAGSSCICAGTPVLLQSRGSHEHVTAAHLADPRAVTEIGGSFVLITWNAVEHTLTIVNDPMGMQPFYESQNGSRRAFASEIKGVLAAGVVDATPDVGGWSGLLFFGHPLNDKTVISNISRFPMGTIAGIDAATGQLTRNNYAVFPQRPASFSSLADSSALLLELLRAEVAAICTVYPRGTLLLSGGFDSRLLLALAHGLCSLDLFVQHHPDELADMEFRFASTVAARFGERVNASAPARSFFNSQQYLWFLERNELNSSSLYLFIATIAGAVKRSMGSVWDGLAIDPALRFTKANGTLSEYLTQVKTKRATNYLKAAELVFSPGWADALRTAFNEELATIQQKYSDDGFGVWQFSIENRTRARIATNPLQVFDAIVPVITPGLSQAFWQEAVRVDPAFRSDLSLYRRILGTADNRTLSVPIVSGGTYVSMSDRRSSVGTYAKLLASVEALIRRPKARVLLDTLGLPAPFEFEPSRFVDEALESEGSSAYLSSRIHDTLRNWKGNQGIAHNAKEMLFYWSQANRIFRSSTVPTPPAPPPA